MRERSIEPALAIDSIFHLLADAYRRFILYYVHSQDNSVPLEELVGHIALCVQPNSPLSSTERYAIRSEVEEQHLPELQAYDVISYDAHNEMVVMNDGFPLLTEILQGAKQYELGE